MSDFLIWSRLTAPAAWQRPDCPSEEHRAISWKSPVVKRVVIYWMAMVGEAWLLPATAVAWSPGETCFHCWAMAVNGRAQTVLAVSDSPARVLMKGPPYLRKPALCTE